MKNDKRLSPKIKIGCSKCNKIQDEDLEFNTSSFKFSPQKSTKVTSIKTKPKKPSKVVSLF